MDILATARANFQRALAHPGTAQLPDAGHRWDTYCRHLRLMIGRFSSIEQVIEHAQTKAGFETRHTGEALLGYARSMEDMFASSFAEFAAALPTFRDTPLAAAGTTIEYNGRLVSSPVYFHTLILMRCLRECRPQRVLEIGGGTGGPGRMWMTNGLHRPQLYINVDFPESLFYAEVYLRATLPDIDIVYAHDTMELPAAGRTCIVLCPIAHIEAVRPWPIDLVVNSGSMQEMSDAYADFYCDVMRTGAWERFYTFNYFAQDLSRREESMNLGAPRLDPAWELTFSAYHGGHRGGHAELMFRRASVDRDACERAAEVALADAKSPSKTFDGEAFLRLFDAVRRAEHRSDLMVETASTAVARLPWVPKEALWLLRKAGTDASAKPETRGLLQRLEEMAAASDLKAIQQHAVTGRVRKKVLIVDGIRYPIARGIGGSAEYVLELEGGIDLAGWAGDPERNRPADAIVASVDGTVVVRTKPVGERSDIEAGYGDRLRPAQFTIQPKLPKSEGGELPLVELFAIVGDRAKRIPICQPEGIVARFAERRDYGRWFFRLGRKRSAA